MIGSYFGYVWRLLANFLYWMGGSALKRMDEADYNDRLFAGGFRRRFHLARFEWARQALIRSGAPCRRVVELGCFDGRAIGFLPNRPEHYVGIDANWEGGLELGQKRFENEDSFFFHYCRTPDVFREIVTGQTFDTAICLETFEHVSPHLVDGYIEAFAEVTTHSFVVTVPNEKGLVFLAKYLIKHTFGETHPYRLSEILSATLGRMDNIERNDHKGFDYENIVGSLRQCFQISEVSGYPFRLLPKSLGFGIGVLATTNEVV